MNQIVTACGLEPDQLDLLSVALPDGYALCVEDWVDDAVCNSMTCCLLCELGISEQDPFVAYVGHYTQAKIPCKIIWVGGYPPFRDFTWYKCFEDVIQELDKILQEVSQ